MRLRAKEQRGPNNGMLTRGKSEGFEGGIHR